MAQGNFRKLGSKSVPNLLDKIGRTEIVDDVTSGGSGVPLSAEQGKTLNVKVNTEIGDRISGDAAIRGSATSLYNDLGKTETVIKQNKATADQAIVDLRTELTSVINTNVDALESADATINSKVTQEVSDRQAAIAAEASARSTALSNIESALAQEVGDRTTAVANVDTAYKAANVIIQNNIDAAKTALELADNTESAARAAADTTLDGKIATEKTERIAAISVVTSSISNEIDNRVSADNAIDQRVSALETTVATGVQLRGSVQSLADLDALVESEVESGWIYIVESGSSSSEDIYIVVPDNSGEYKPAGWTLKSFKWMMDYSDVTNVVTTERTQRITSDTQLQNNINTLEGTVTSNKSVLDSALATLRTDMQNADAAAATARTNGDAALQAGLDAEISNRETAVSTVSTNLTAEIAAREAAITSEAATRQTAVEAVQANVDAEATARQAAVSTEANARISGDATNATAIQNEVTARQAAIETEVAAREAAVSALDARVDVLEGDSTIVGSVAKALLDAKKYTDAYIPIPMIEGSDGTLLVVGDTVTLNNIVWRGLSGVLLGEVIVYQANGDAVMVPVGNVSGNVITLKADTTGEHNGCEVKVHYLFIEADQNGSGMGVAGSGGAGA